MNVEQIEEAEAFFYTHLDEQGIQELEHFIAHRDSYENRAVNINDPVNFWILLEDTYENLSKFALTILIIPASTARIEGLFSHWTYVHNKYRNRLDSTTSAQLLDIYSFFASTIPSYRPKPKKKHIAWQ